jgi:hypothetical protein
MKAFNTNFNTGCHVVAKFGGDFYAITFITFRNDTKLKVSKLKGVVLAQLNSVKFYLQKCHY